MTKNLNDMTPEEFAQFLAGFESLKQENAQQAREIKKLQRSKRFGLVWEYSNDEQAEELLSGFPVLRHVPEKQLRITPTEIGSIGLFAETQRHTPNNAFIAGDNLHVLTSLMYTHQGKIDVIYIDPPYNTGASNWRYNNDYVGKEDVWRHSKWLSFMHKRLLLAKSLLAADGIMVITIDENEHPHLCVMLEDMFPSKDITSVTVVHNPRGIQGDNFSYSHEYYVFLTERGMKQTARRILDYEDNSPFANWGAGSERACGKNTFYPIIVRDGTIVGFGDVPDTNVHPNVIEPQEDGSIYVYPVDAGGVERKWRYSRTAVGMFDGKAQAFNTQKQEKHSLRYDGSQNGSQCIRIIKNTGTYKTVWSDPKYDAGTHGTKLVNAILGAGSFPFPKSLYAVKDAVHAMCSHKKDAIVLDFFAGSGTTGHAVLALNQEDGGTRQFILCANNENNIAEEVTYERLRRVITGDWVNPPKGGVEPLGGNLDYFRCEVFPLDDSESQVRRDMADTAIGTLMVKHDVYDTVASGRGWTVLRNDDIAVGICTKIQPARNEMYDAIKRLDIPREIYLWSADVDNTNDSGLSRFRELPNTTIHGLPDEMQKEYKRANRKWEIHG